MCLGIGLSRNGVSSFLKHISTQLCGQGTLTSEFSICLGFLSSCEQLVLRKTSPHPCFGTPGLAVGYTHLTAL